MLNVGTCCLCHAPTWRWVSHPTTHAPIPLWPMPSTLFLAFQLANGNLVNAIGVCPCYDGQLGASLPDAVKAQMAASAALAVERDVGYTATDVDRAVLVGSATARERYSAWFVPPYGEHLRAWLRDFVRMEDAAAEEIMAQWRQDRLA